ncbi:MAG: FG-GAP-like repeat-containing protein [Pyrinomonadaceae bacterium]
MKKYVLFLATLTLAVSFFLSQRPVETKSEPRFEQVSRPHAARAAGFAVSGPLRDVADSRTGSGGLPKDLSVRQVGAGNELFSRPVTRHDADLSLSDFGSLPMPEPSQSFPGIADLDNAIIYSLLILPPDMNGDVGPNHYVQIVNSLFRVFDKGGQPMSQPLKISKLFEPLGTICSTRNDGLAIVLYDPLADRWLISQTCTAFPPFRQMLAISKTGDPLGEYYSYEFVMPSVRLNDFPKFGVWPDAYYMSTDEFLGADYVGAGAFAFDRTKLLAGDSSASYVYFNLPVPVGPRQKGLLPADLDGLRPPPDGAPNVFASYTATEYGDAQDALRLYNFHADFNDPLSSTFSERGESPIAVTAFDPTSPEGRADISQPPPGEKLDAQSDRLNFRLSYRNFGTYESLVVNQTVRTTPADPYRAGVRVYELRKTDSNYAVREQSTIGGGTSSRWIASAAQDHQGNLAVQYNTVSDDKQPSIFYTGKLASDPPGVFRTERPLVNGTGVQKAFGWRWGEYSGMSVDPIDDCTFWMTNAYYTLESQQFSDFGWLTRIGSFKFTECTAAPRGSITGSVTNSATGQPLPDAVIKAGAYTRATNALGSYGTLSVLPATYSVTASARGFLPQTVSVTVGDGQVQTRNFALQPVPIIQSSGTQIEGQTCPINQAPEPGETVTLVISLQNTGVLSASALTATLLPSTEIINPGPPRSYGQMSPGSPPVSRAFTFTVSPSVSCGTVVLLNLEIRDGDAFIGTVSVPLQTGVRRFALQENFDGVTAPSLPDGWSTTSSANHQLWRTSATRKQSAPNSLFSPAPFQQGMNEVISPPFSVTSANAEISFRNWYELETTFLRNRLYDGSVLELKIGNGDWQDILAAGGTFLSGGYDGTIDGCCMNPLAGRLGWSGRSGLNDTSEFITTRAKLPASAAGQSVQLRFRIGSDIGGFREGQYIDNLEVADGFVCSCESGNKAPFDFDGDRKTDLSVFDLNAGGQPDFRIVNSSTNQLSSAAWGTAGDVPANADFDGDGKTDLAVYRPAEGTWYIVRSLDGGSITVRFGIAADLVVPADYDGDGKADVAVFRPESGVWYVLRSSDGQVSATQFGLPGDKPVIGDFDADSKTDVAVYRPSTGTWFYLLSSKGSVEIVRFGVSEDLPVTGDYDGDGRSDVAVFRPSTGVWYVLRSRAGFTAVQFGLNGDIPMQADFDGDGRSEITVFRPSNKVWYHLRSSDSGFVSRFFGEAAERPVPGIFVDR